MFAAEGATRVHFVMASTVQLTLCKHTELKKVMFGFAYPSVCLSVCLFVKGLRLHEKLTYA